MHCQQFALKAYKIEDGHRLITIVHLGYFRPRCANKGNFLCLFLSSSGFSWLFSFVPVFKCCCLTPRDLQMSQHILLLLSPHLCFIIGFICDLFVACNDSGCVRRPQCRPNKYRIRPNYRTVCLGFSKLLGTLRCDKICTYTYYRYTIKRSEKALFDDDYVIFFLIFFIKAYVVGTHLNCTDKML